METWRRDALEITTFFVDAKINNHMVKKVGKLNICGACGFKYKTKELASKCEAWCTKNKSCNLEITKHAIN
ncbi:hypothetical protein HOH11_00230 [Candidatus Woesearchaeota archaeon]|jgi:hypothetical protein|nr:hypothetical protein [Candidatus Woesearchaeota archaeon]